MDFHWEYEGIIGCVINDPLAVAYFTDRDMCTGFEQLYGSGRQRESVLDRQW